MSTPRPGYLLPFGSPVGTQLFSTAHPNRHLHAVGCVVDGGTRVNGRAGFRCLRCSYGPIDRANDLRAVVEAAVFRG